MSINVAAGRLCQQKHMAMRRRPLADLSAIAGGPGFSGALDLFRPVRDVLWPLSLFEAWLRKSEVQLTRSESME